ncbi:hypothetical protein C0J52_05154 [Blattella germanica]|nr:hypothetical protein C0J52_05154 [Blattella germanica]
MSCSPREPDEFSDKDTFHVCGVVVNNKPNLAEKQSNEFTEWQRDSPKMPYKKFPLVSLASPIEQIGFTNEISPHEWITLLSDRERGERNVVSCIKFPSIRLSVCLSILRFP